MHLEFAPDAVALDPRGGDFDLGLASLEFRDLAGLLKSVRYTGSGGRGPRKGWSRGRLARVERAYRERFGGIRATYQVFLCRGAGRKGEAG